MLLLEIKLVATLAILAVGIVGGMIPLLAARHDTSRRFLSLGNALAGGIFLGAGFIHLLPEAGEALEGVVDYPLAPLLAAVGVVALLLIDRVLFESSHARGSDENAEARQPIYPLVLLVVLSIHSVIAGIALGIETELAASLLVMIAILSHKGSAAFALIVSVQAAGADRRRLLRVLTIFVVMTPLGILLGTVGLGSVYEGDTALLLIEGTVSTRWLREPLSTWPSWTSSMRKCTGRTTRSRITCAVPCWVMTTCPCRNMTRTAYTNLS